MLQSVTELRKAGKLVEAYDLAKLQLEKDFSDVWSKRAMAWVLYEYIKQSIENKNNKEFVQYVTELSNLYLQADDTMIADKMQWQYAKYIQANYYNCDVSNSIIKITNFLNCIEKIPFKQACVSYSQFMRTIHKAIKESNNNAQYIAIMDKLNFIDNLQNEDFKSFKPDNGKPIMSLAEQIYIRYAKALIEVLKFNLSLTNDNSQLIDATKYFIQKLEILGANHKEYVYPIYFQAQLLLTLCEYKKAKELLIPFVKDKKSKEFWAWQKLGDAVFVDDKEMALSCYCMGLLCPAPADKLISLKESTAKLMVEQHFFNEAKTEIEFVNKIRTQNEWKLSDFIQQAFASEWYNNAKSNKSNKKFYELNSVLCEDLLYGDDKKKITITAVNLEKSIMNFKTDDGIRGFMPYYKILKQDPQKGETYNVVFVKLKKDSYCTVKSITKII